MEMEPLEVQLFHYMENKHGTSDILKNGLVAERGRALKKQLKEPCNQLRVAFQSTV
jgi:hypothetical protein